MFENNKSVRIRMLAGTFIYEWIGIKLFLWEIYAASSKLNAITKFHNTFFQIEFFTIFYFVF
jgi:hypothetical protein